MNNVKSKSDKSNTFYALVLQWKPKKTFKYFKHIPDKQPVEYSHKSVEHHKNNKFKFTTHPFMMTDCTFCK